MNLNFKESSQQASNPTMAGQGADDYLTYSGNDIYFYTAVNNWSAYNVNFYLRTIEQENLYTHINLHINSGGGSILSALSIIGTIKSLKIPVHSYIDGWAASAATMISVGCDKRYIFKHSYMLIHQLSSGFWGKFNEFDDNYSNLKMMMEDIKKIYTENALFPDGPKLDDLLKHDLYLPSEQCLSYKLVDEIVDRKLLEIVVPPVVDKHAIHKKILKWGLYITLPITTLATCKYLWSNRHKN